MAELWSGTDGRRRKPVRVVECNLAAGGNTLFFEICSEVVNSEFMQGVALNHKGSCVVS